MTPLPSVVHAEYAGGHRIRVTFNDHSENTIDFRQWLDGPLFEPLKDPAYFQQFSVKGGTLVWPNGADIAPETLYDEQGRQRLPQRPARSAKMHGRAERKPGARGPRHPRDGARAEHRFDYKKRKPHRFGPESKHPHRH